MNFCINKVENLDSLSFIFTEKKEKFFTHFSFKDVKILQIMQKNP